MKILLPSNLDELPEECWFLEESEEPSKTFSLKLNLYGVGNKIKITLISKSENSDSQATSMFKSLT